MGVFKKAKARSIRGGEISEDGVIPLINIVFLLLIFFLLAGHIAPPEPVDVEPPQTSASPDEAAEPATLHIQADGALFHDAEPVTDLMATATALGTADGPRKIIIRADKDAPAELVLAVADALRKARVDETQLVVARAR